MAIATSVGDGLASDHTTWDTSPALPVWAADKLIIAHHVTWDLDHPAQVSCHAQAGVGDGITINNAGGHFEIQASKTFSPEGDITNNCRTVNKGFTINYGTSIAPTKVRWVMASDFQWRYTNGYSVSDGAYVYWGVGSGASGTYTPKQEPIVFTTNDPTQYRIYNFTFQSRGNGEIRNIMVDAMYGTFDDVYSPSTSGKPFIIEGNLTFYRTRGDISSSYIYSDDLVINIYDMYDPAIGTFGPSSTSLFGNIRVNIRNGTYSRTYVYNTLFLYDSCSLYIYPAVDYTYNSYSALALKCFDNSYVDIDYTGSSFTTGIFCYQYCWWLDNASIKFKYAPRLLFRPGSGMRSNGTLEIDECKATTDMYLDNTGTYFYGWKTMYIHNATPNTFYLTTGVVGASHKRWQFSNRKEFIIENCTAPTVGSPVIEPIVYSTNRINKTAKLWFIMHPIDESFYILTGGATMRPLGGIDFTGAGDTATFEYAPWSVLSWDDVTIQDDAGGHTYEFRWSSDNGSTWSSFLALTQANLQAITQFGFKGQDKLQIKVTAAGAGYVTDIVIDFHYLIDFTYSTDETITIEDRIVNLQADSTDILADSTLILADTDETQQKLPDNYIMGSSVTTDKDDEIDNTNLIVGANLDVAVSSRSTFDEDTDKVTVEANEDKTGYSLAEDQSDVTIGTVIDVDLSSVEDKVDENKTLLEKIKALVSGLF